MLELSYKGIANWEDVCLITDPVSGRRFEHPWNFTMGVYLMHTKMSGIKHDNAAEFYKRAKLIEACTGALFTNSDGTPRYLIPDDVIKYIGLASNVSQESEAAFFKHLRANVTRNLVQTMKYALEAHDKAIKARVQEVIAADPELSRIDRDATVDPEEHGIIQE
jgi:hypothetical protein